MDWLSPKMGRKTNRKRIEVQERAIALQGKLMYKF
jgi:hypothetical protein